MGQEKKRRRRYTSSQASQTRFGKDEPEAAPSCKLLFPSLSFSVAFSSACNSSRPISPHSVSEVPTLAGKGWDRSPEAVRATAAVAKTCFKKNRSHLGSGSDARDVPHLRMPHDSRHPKCSGKVGMRYFHRPRNRFHCPTIDAGRSWSLGPNGIKDPATACDDSSALLTGITPPCYSEILGRNALTGCPYY